MKFLKVFFASALLAIQLVSADVDLQSLVDNDLLGSGKIAEAVIFNDESKDHAKSSNFQIDPSSIGFIVDHFKLPLMQGSIMIEGKFFAIYKELQGVVIASNGNRHFVAARTNAYFIITLVAPSVDPEEAEKVVRGVVEKLSSA